VTTGELSYSQSSHNPILRGTIPLALAALNIDYGRREFILDSGADIWYLRASNDSEFDIWKTRLEDVWLKAVAGRQRALQDEEEGLEISSDWKTVEGLVDRLSMMKDFVGGMVQDLAEANSKSKDLSPVASVSPGKPVAGGGNEVQKERMKIFKRQKDKPTPSTSPPREPPNHSVNTASSPQRHSQGKLAPRQRKTYHSDHIIRDLCLRYARTKTYVPRPKSRIHPDFLPDGSL
jgi:oxysterol-binding protein-related protein 3/6/7